MAKFVCKECGYRLEGNPTKKMCPYCSKETLREEPDAGDILDEVEKILD